MAAIALGFEDGLSLSGALPLFNWWVMGAGLKPLPRSTGGPTSLASVFPLFGIELSDWAGLGSEAIFNVWLLFKSPS